MELRLRADNKLVDSGTFEFETDDVQTLKDALIEAATSGPAHDETEVQ